MSIRIRNAPVTVRVTDQTFPVVLITHIGGQRIASDASERLSVKFFGLRKRPGMLWFSANDGRRVPPTVDRTETMWSNTATIRCT